jgi:hypothetical protein
MTPLHGRAGLSHTYGAIIALILIVLTYLVISISAVGLGEILNGEERPEFALEWVNNTAVKITLISKGDMEQINNITFFFPRKVKPSIWYEEDGSIDVGDSMIFSNINWPLIVVTGIVDGNTRAVLINISMEKLKEFLPYVKD